MSVLRGAFEFCIGAGMATFISVAGRLTVTLTESLLLLLTGSVGLVAETVAVAVNVPGEEGAFTEMVLETPAPETSEATLHLTTCIEGWVQPSKEPMLKPVRQV